MNEKGVLIVVSGPSGAGKGTLCKGLLNRDDVDVTVSVSATTRQPRRGEIEGKTYFFKEKADFEKMIGKNEFLEYAQVYGNYYGTPREFVLKQLAAGRNVLLEIDIQGAMQVRETYPQGVFVFVLPPSMIELRKRIVARGSETKKSLETRFFSAFEEIECIKKYDYYIINDKVDRACDILASIVKAESHRVVGNVESLIQKIKGEQVKC